ncbi:VOC family protein [Petrocella sp. FN5]|uniref:VOC family protein n=1 Tax=Petrocella sp. FN5 TaxID=3032002 RepID=UPI0023DBE636|nr:VOC family protein [Petrocella sp. FN5]MDF1618712.1 VOC family protein [Petrocella sp. FN5]
MTLHHICIQTDCYYESIQFYKEIFGFVVVKETKGFHGRHFNSWIKRDNFMIELQTNRVDEVLIDYNKRRKG